MKTRAFQEACVYSVVEELVEHLSQWSCSVAFFELSFIPTIRLRSFCKSTKAERFRKEMKQLISQVPWKKRNGNLLDVSYTCNKRTDYIDLCVDDSFNLSRLLLFSLLFRLKLTQSLSTKRELRLNFYPMILLLNHSLRFSNSYLLTHLNFSIGSDNNTKPIFVVFSTSL